MKLYFHYCSFGFSNCYVLGTDDGDLPVGSPPQAIIIDPGSMDTLLLECIERNDYVLRAVLLTHDHRGHVHGLRTLKRIYKTEIFAINRFIHDHNTTPVKDEDKLDIGHFHVEIISIPGHSADSVAYKIDNLLFTGDALTSGLVGSTDSAYGAKTQMNTLRSRLLSLPGDYIVLPGHGPPSTLEAERRYNVGINQYSDIQNRKPGFKLSL